VIDIGEKSMTWTFTALMNGEAGYFFSDGRARLGGKGQEPEAVRSAARQLCAVAGKFVAKSKPATDFPSPQLGHWQFFLLTASGVRVASASEEALALGDELSPLYYSVLDLRDAWSAGFK
jgi:hypothetical protein